MKTQIITYGCRDRNGNHEGCSPIIRFNDVDKHEALQLGNWDGRNNRFGIDVQVDFRENWIRFGKYRKMEFISYTTHYGNICNDLFKVRPADGADLCNYLINAGFSPESGYTEVWDKIDAGQLLTPTDFGFPYKYRCPATMDLFNRN